MTRRTGLAAAAAALLAGCSGTRALDALVTDRTYTLRGDVPYGTDLRQKLDVYVPRSADGEATVATAATASPWPVVVFFYGGSWTRGERADYRFVGESLASAGVLTVVADYRLSPQVRWPDMLQDGAAAVRWTADHVTQLGGDARRVHVMGHSAGGWIAAMLALDSRWLGSQRLSPRQLAGWIGLAGPYDFLPIGDPEVRIAFNWPDTPRESQPIVHASAGAPRALLIAPEKDALVDPDRNTEGMARRLRDLRVPVTVHRHSGVNHVTLAGSLASPLRWLAPTRREVLDFLAAPVR